MKKNTLKAPWAVKRFSQLSADQQQQIREFSFPTETFKGISDKSILEVFCRLNERPIYVSLTGLWPSRPDRLMAQLHFYQDISTLLKGMAKDVRHPY